MGVCYEICISNFWQRHPQQLSLRRRSHPRIVVRPRTARKAHSMKSRADTDHPVDLRLTATFPEESFPRRPEVEVALRNAAVNIRWRMNYSDLLREVVFVKKLMDV